MEEKQKKFVFNLMLIIILVLCLVMGALVIILSTLNTKVEIIGKSGDKISNSYTSAETVSNTWDVSENGDGTVTATLADDGTLTISGAGAMKKDANDEWYSERYRIKKVIIEDGVTTIGYWAFGYCGNLASIKISSSVISIGDYAFYSCENLTSVEIPGSVTSIGAWAFKYCESLTSIEISDGLTSIGNGAFDNCINLTSIDVNENNANYKDDNGVLYTKDGSQIIKYPAGRTETEYEIIGGTTSIEDNAFQHCSDLTSIGIPASVTDIEVNAFDGCSSLITINVNENNTIYMDDNGVLYTKDEIKIIRYPEGKSETEYIILSNTTSIGSYAFSNCTSLNSIEIPANVTSIGSYAFYYCTNLNSIDIPSTVTTIGIYAFSGCTVIQLFDVNNNIEFPSLLKRAQDENDILYTSSSLQLTNCTIEDNIIKITDRNSSAKIKVASGKLSGLTYLFSYNSWDVSENGDGNVIAVLEDDGTLTIQGKGNMKSWNSSDSTDWHGVKNKVKTVIINDGVNNIGNYAFDDCENLTSIEISKSVTNIEYSAFYDCTSLVAIKVNENNSIYKDCNGVLYSKDETQIIRYPEGKKETEYTIPSGTTGIREGAFGNCYFLTNIVIPNGVVNIGSGAFDSCVSLINVEIPNSVDYIGAGAFYECYSLESIKIPSGVEIIEDSTFEYCYSLKNISIPDSIIKIGWFAFAGCYSLTSIELPNGIETIDGGAFGNCVSLTNISIPRSVITIGSYAFEGCISMTNIEIPEGITSIEYYAFAGCENLASISIPNSVINIGTYIFDGCDNLTIICKDGSVAVNYAKENNINYLIIDKIALNTTVSQLIQNFGNETWYEITDKNGNAVLETEYVGTGFKVKVKNGGSYAIIITGDTSGDGKSDIQDIFAINKHRLNKGELTNEYLLAGDVNKDNKTNVNDIFQINKYRLGIIKEL